MLPPMPQLMPPLPLNDLILINLIPRPHLLILLIQKDTLEYVSVIWHVRLIHPRGLLIRLPELMLVIRAVEAHLDFLRVFLVRVRIVHRPVSTCFAILPVRLVARKAELLFLRL